MVALLVLATATAAACAADAGRAGAGAAGPDQGPPPTATTAARPAPDRAYRHPRHGFSVSYPAAWKLEEQPPEQDLLVRVIAPDGRAGLSVSLLPGQRLDDEALAAFAAALDAAYPQAFPAFQRHQARMTEVAGAPALEYLFSHTAAGGERQTTRQVFLTHGGAVYALTYTAPARDFGRWDGTVAGMIQGFRWEPAP